MESETAFLKWAVDQHTPEIFRTIPVRIMHEGGVLKSNYSADVSYQTSIERIATNFTIATSEMLTNPNIVFEKLWESAPALAAKKVENAIGAITNATEAVGNSYQISELTPETFLGMIERLEVTFQGNGTPNLPQLLAGSEMLAKFARMKPAWEANPEYASRMNEIIDNKRIKWNERQAARKLAE